MRALFLALLAVFALAAVALSQQSPEEEKSYFLRYVEDTISSDNRRISITGIDGVLSSDATIGAITVADRKGVWLTITDAKITWTRSALLTGRLVIDRLSAASIAMTRMPVPDESLPSPEAGGFSLPELPVSVRIGNLAVGEATFAEAVFGEAATLSLNGALALADGSLAGARKGSGNWSLKVSGRAAHAGREHHLGRNALAAACQFGLGLDELNGRREGVTFNLARIDGGGPPNVVPDNAVARFNVRVKTENDRTWVEAELERLLDEIRVRDGIAAELHGGFTRPPKPMSPANARMFEWTKAAGGALGLDIRWQDTGGVCEGNNLWAAGCPNVDTLGVMGGRIHSNEEYVLTDSFAERAVLSALILNRLADGRLDGAGIKALMDS